MKLIDLFKELPVPTEKKEEFTALPIDENSNHKIGKNIDGKPSILIYVDEKTDEIIPNTVLKNISIYYDMNCSVNLENKIQNKVFTVITFTGEDESLYESFLRVSEILIQTIGINPKRKDVSTIVKKFIKLFKNISDSPLKSIQGLWAELFIISLAKDTKKYIDAWHITPEDKYDFNFGKKRIEVKSSSNRKREHYFSLGQIEEFDNTEILFCSLFVEKSPGGKSIEDLINEIKKKVKGNFDCLEKLFFICYRVLGNSLDDSFKIRFDTQIAKHSLKIYALEDVPKIKRKDLQKGIIDIKLKISLENINSITYSFT